MKTEKPPRLRCVLGLLAFAVCVAGQSSSDTGGADYIRTATQFCNMANYTEFKCGFSDEGGVGPDPGVKLPSGLFAGTMWSGWYNSNLSKDEYPPVTHEGQSSYYQLLPRVVSVACHGPVEVSLIFKRTESGGGGGCVKLDNLEENGHITRCELILPESYDNEDEAAINATVGKCVECATCSRPEDRCPIETGKWYRDTATWNIPDKCPPSDQPLIASIVFDAQVVARIAAFDIYSVK